MVTNPAKRIITQFQLQVNGYLHGAGGEVRVLMLELTIQGEPTLLLILTQQGADLVNLGKSRTRTDLVTASTTEIHHSTNKSLEIIF